MPESPSHKRAKAKAAGKSGKTEVSLTRSRRLDAQTRKTAIEIERSGSTQALTKAVGRLKASGKAQKVLQVPQQDMAKASKAMKKVGVKADLVCKNRWGSVVFFCIQMLCTSSYSSVSLSCLSRNLVP